MIITVRLRTYETLIPDVPRGLSGWEYAAAFCMREGEDSGQQVVSLLQHYLDGFNVYHVSADWDDFRVED